MFCIEISKKQIFFFKLAVFYFCDNFAKRTKREQKEMEKKRFVWQSRSSSHQFDGRKGAVPVPTAITKTVPKCSTPLFVYIKVMFSCANSNTINIF